MPELPEVETVVQDLIASGLIGKTLINAEVHWLKTIADLKKEEFCQRIKGQHIRSINRRAKFLVFSLSKDTLIFHLRMTGRLRIANPTLPHVKEERLVLNLSSGEQLRFEDTRKFGRCYLVASPHLILDKLGPEPLDEKLTPELFFQRLSTHSRKLKSLLLDQAFLAGLGNIYVDEALWEAKLHPLQTSNTLTEKESHILLDAIRRVLQRGLESQGTTLGNGRTNFYRLDGSKGKNISSLKVFRRTGQACPRCQRVIKKIIVAQRGTHFCPNCQR